jgi:hypothetical protein
VTLQVITPIGLLVNAEDAKSANDENDDENDDENNDAKNNHRNHLPVIHFAICSSPVQQPPRARRPSRLQRNHYGGRVYHCLGVFLIPQDFPPRH